MNKVNILSRIMLRNGEISDERSSDGISWTSSNIPISTSIFYPKAIHKFSLDFSNCPDYNGGYYVVSNNDFAVGSNNYSIGMWVKENRRVGSWRSILGPYGGNYFTIWQIDRYVAGPALTWGSGDWNSGPNSISDGQWHSVVFSRAKGTVRLFVDGKLNTSGWIGEGTVINTSNLRIGNGYDNAPFNGWISDFTISTAAIEEEFDLKKLKEYFPLSVSVTYDNFEVGDLK